MSNIIFLIHTAYNCILSACTWSSCKYNIIYSFIILCLNNHFIIDYILIEHRNQTVILTANLYSYIIKSCILYRLLTSDCYLIFFCCSLILRDNRNLHQIISILKIIKDKSVTVIMVDNRLCTCTWWKHQFNWRILACSDFSKLNIIYISCNVNCICCNAVIKASVVFIKLNTILWIQNN